MPVSAPIATARLDLVPLSVEDAAEMVDVLADPALYTVIGGRPPSLAELVARYRAQVAGRSADGREEWHNWIVRERPGGAAVGFVQATIADASDAESGQSVESAGMRGTPGRRGGVAEIAWVIGRPWQGRGYGGEAARGLVAWLESRAVERIEAHVAPGHRASAAVARKAGLEPTEELVDGEVVWRRGTRSRDPAG